VWEDSDLVSTPRFRRRASPREDTRVWLERQRAVHILWMIVVLYTYGRVMAEERSSNPYTLLNLFSSDSQKRSKIL